MHHAQGPYTDLSHLSQRCNYNFKHMLFVGFLDRTEQSFCVLGSVLHRFETSNTFSYYCGGGWKLSRQSNSQFYRHAFGDCLTQEEGVHRTREVGGKAYPVGIREDGSQEVDLAFLVARIASGVSQRQVDPLSQSKRMQVSNDRSRSKVLETIRTGRHHSHSAPSRHTATRATRKLNGTKKVRWRFFFWKVEKKMHEPHSSCHRPALAEGPLQIAIQQFLHGGSRALEHASSPALGQPLTLLAFSSA
jgi:hypothetical protein